MSKECKKQVNPKNKDLEARFYVERKGDNSAYELLQDGDYESEDILVHNGVVYERTDEVKIDVTLIPDHVRDDLAAATLELVRNILRQPGGREMLDAKKAELEAFKAQRAAKASTCKSDD